LFIYYNLIRGKGDLIKFLSIFVFFTPIFSYACPGCAGSVNNEADNYTVYILMGFIGIIYIPFFMLYKLFFKYKNINKIEN
jgi:hypothetical protein